MATSASWRIWKSKPRQPEVQWEKTYFLMEKRNDLVFYKRERVPGPEWSAASHFFFLPLTKKSQKSK